MDGFIEGPEGELDWLFPHVEITDAAGCLTGFDTLFFGRKAYERLDRVRAEGGVAPNGRWPFADAAIHIRKYVFSRRRKHVAGNAMVISEDIEGEVRRIRKEDGKNILFCGGADLLRTFAALDLVDEYLLSVYPVLLGSGKPLFSEPAVPRKLRLLQKHKMASGIVRLHYIPLSRMTYQYYDRRGV